MLENLSGLDRRTGPITIADNTTIGVNQLTVQNVTVTGGSGTFALTFTNALGVSKSTGQLPFNATALQVANALNGLTNIPAGGVISVIATPVTVPSAGIVYTVTFGGTMDTTNQLPLVASVLNGAIAVVDAVKTGNAVSSLTLDPAAGIADSLGTSSLTKVGTGTLFLPAPNSYGGQTLVDAGILDISDPGARHQPEHHGRQRGQPRTERDRRQQLQRGQRHPDDQRQRLHPGRRPGPARPAVLRRSARRPGKPQRRQHLEHDRPDYDGQQLLGRCPGRLAHHHQSHHR